MNPVINLSNVNVFYGENKALENVNLTVREHEFLGIIGPNGGGKTTLLKILLGLLKPDSGSVEIYGSPPDKKRGVFGYVSQFSDFEKNYPISVFDVVLMGRLGSKGNFRRFNKKDFEIVKYTLEKVNLSAKKNTLIHKLSGGEIQRTLIARALCVQPKILLFDEPTASVDSKEGKNFYELLKELNREITIILVSHDIGAISQHVKKIACLNKKLIFHDSKQLTPEMIEQTYHCPVDLIAHGVPHRVFDEHKH